MAREGGTGRAALVTGGGTGIGAAIARRLARDGLAVAVTGRREEPLRAVADELAAGGGRALAVPADVSEPAGAEHAVAAAVEAFGGLDVLVCNAGISRPGAVLDQTPESFERVLRTNLVSAFLTCRAALPRLLERGGAIVTISSISGLRVAPESAAYCTSKAALVMLTRTIALDYGPRGVRANCICPAWVRTEMADRAMDDLAALAGTDREGAYALAHVHVPLRRAGLPGEVAELAAFVASPAGAYLNGTAIPLDGGNHVVDAAMAAWERT